MNCAGVSGVYEKKRIFVYGYFGAGNLGDELILTAFLTMLDGRGDKFRLTVAVENANDYDGGYYARRFPNLEISFIKRRKNPLALENLAAFAASRAFVIPGGGIFQDYNPLSFMCYFSFLLCAKLFGLKIYLLFQGLTGIRRKIFEKLMNFALARLVDYASVRDASSQRLLKSSAAKTFYAGPVFADPVFAVESSFRGVKTVVAEAGGGSLGVSLRPWKGVEAEAVARSLETLAESAGLTIILYSMQKKTDCGLNARVEDFISRRGRVNISRFEYTSDAAAVLRSLAANRLNLGMRFHFCLLSMAAGVPCIGLSYDEKVAGLYAAANLRQLCLCGREFEDFMAGEAAGAVKRAAYAVKNAPALAAAMTRYAEASQNIARTMFDDFYAGCLAGGGAPFAFGGGRE